MKCGIIFFGVLIILDFLFESLNLYFIADNENFDVSYPVVYGIILIALLVAAIMYLVYFIRDDSPQTRALLPIAILISIIGQFVLAFWIILYISCIHPDSIVYVN